MWSQSKEYLELTEFRQSKNEFSTERFKAIPNKMPGFPVGKESTFNAGDIGHGFEPWRRAWQPTPVFLSGNSHGQRSLVGYSPSGCNKSDMTKATEQAHQNNNEIFHVVRTNNPNIYMKPQKTLK